MKTLKDIGELAAIEQICQRLPSRDDIIHGAGDDCAVIRPVSDSPFDLLLTSDPTIENIHFTPQTPLHHVGHKAIGRALSDIAAMGGEPRWALINLSLPPEANVDTIDMIYDGALSLATKHNLAITGGDTSEAPLISINAFVVGSIPSGTAVTRAGAELGDILFTTGTLGGSLTGKHLSFEPRIQEGIFLRKWATSMIDITDGLASDLAHITKMSKVGATIETKNIPISNSASKISDNKSPTEHALFDGEDFELLFTIKKDDIDKFRTAWKSAFDLQCSQIGEITDRKDIIKCINTDGKTYILNGKGYEHFA